jgi:NAD(P)-dependent dehydrogenase (short-subunit alcohol dehydrogenase family)
MSTIPSEASERSILIVGASRGLGLAMATEFNRRGWRVLGTSQRHGNGLDELAARHPDAVAVETLDITEPEQIAALRDRLADRRFDIVFVNAGTANRRQGETIADVSTDEFVRVMITNALGVMRTVEALGALTPADGMIGVMSSGQGSIANNTNGGHEVYRGSKAALNQYMRSYAARHTGGRRAMVLMAPGWIRTELGGPDAPFDIEETIPHIVDVLIAQQFQPGLRYLDRKGQTVPW